MQSRTPTGRSAYRLLGGFLLVVVLAVLSLTASSTTGASKVSSQAAFRQQLIVFLNQMQHAASSYQATPQGRAAFARLGYDPAANLARARADVRRRTRRSRRSRAR